jgi:hypothetical protein
LAIIAGCTLGGDGRGIGVPGLFAIIASACIVLVCTIGLAANFIIYCIARKSSRRTRRERVLRGKNRRIEANCPFVTSQQMEASNQRLTSEAQKATAENLRSLEEFFELKCNMQSEENIDSHRMSWV